MAYDPLREFTTLLGEQGAESEVWMLWDECIRAGAAEGASQPLARLVKWAEAGSKLAMCMCAAQMRSVGGMESGREAIKWARRAAESGYPPGQFELGRCYEDGVGVPRQLDEAIRLYEASADAGYPQGALALALRYHLGQDIPVDSIRAFHYITRAIELGSAYAPFELATWYEQGHGVATDLSLARHWYEVAAEGGSALACLRLSTAYSFGGLGVMPDRSKATKYEELSRECDAP